MPGNKQSIKTQSTNLAKTAASLALKTGSSTGGKMLSALAPKGSSKGSKGSSKGSKK